LRICARLRDSLLDKPRDKRRFKGIHVGVLQYNDEEYDFDDRVLLHLQVVISTKLRRHENFFLSWTQPIERGSGRHAIWIDNGVPLHFFFNGSRAASINREWLEQLLLSSSQAGGLQVGDEPPARPVASQPAK
jgi:hypothetical protein